MVDLTTLQNDVFDFQQQMFSSQNCKFDTATMFIHLVEEIGEIARQVFNKESGMRSGVDRENLEEEVGQALLDLLVVMKHEGIDASVAAEKKLDAMKLKFKDRL